MFKLSEQNLWDERKEEFKLRGSIYQQDRDYGLNQSFIDTFNKNKLKLNTNKKSQYLLAKNLFDSFLNKSIK